MTTSTVTTLTSGQSALATTTVTFSAQTSGDLLLLATGSDDYKTGDPAGWTLVNGQQGFEGMYLWYKISTGAETSVAYTIGSAVSSAYVLFKATNVNGTTPLFSAVGQHVDSGSTSYTSGTSATTTASVDFVSIAIFGSSLASSSGTQTGLSTWLNSYTAGTTSISSGNVTNDMVGYGYLNLAGGGTTSTGANYTGPNESRSSVLGVFQLVGAAGAATVGAVAATATAASPAPYISNNGTSLVPVTFVAASTWDAPASSATVTPPYPAGLAEGDIVYAELVIKPDTATVTTPANWTLVASAVGGTGTQGAGAGAIQTFLYRRVVPAGGLTGSQAFTITSGSSPVGGMRAFRPAAGFLGVSFPTEVTTSFSRTTSSTTFGGTGGASLGVRNGDALVIVLGSADDQSSTITISAATAPGATLGALTQSPTATVINAQGNDISAASAYALVTAGEETTAPTVTATGSSTETGMGFLYRVRAVGYSMANSTARATASAPAPVVSTAGAGGASVSSVAATATSTSVTPALAVGSTVTSVAATATSTTGIPALALGATITQVRPTATAASTAPALVLGYTITSVRATSTSTTVAPALAVGSSITAVVATATASSTAPGVGAAVNSTVTAVVATGTALAPAPLLSASSGLSPPASTASGTAVAPVVSATSTGTVLGVVATATATSPAPAVSNGGALSYHHLYTTDVPATADTDTTQYTLGMDFQVLASGHTGYAARYYKDTTRYDGATMTAGLWNATGTLLASGSRTQLVGDAVGWVEIPFATPVALTNADVYTVGVQIPAAGYPYTAGYFLVDHDNESIHTGNQAGRYTVTSSLAQPTSPNQASFFIDITTSTTSSGAVDGSVTGVVATSTATALPPVVSGSTVADGTVTAVVATATATLVTPVVSGGAVTGSVTGVHATATAAAASPVVVGGSSGVTVAAVVATATALARVPVVSNGVATPVVQTATTSSVTTPVSLNWTSTPTAGNTLVAVLNADAYAVLPSGWTMLASLEATQGFYVFTKTAGASETGIAVAVAGNNNSALSLIELSSVQLVGVDVVATGPEDLSGTRSFTTPAIATNTSFSGDFNLAIGAAHGIGENALNFGNVSWNNGYTPVLTSAAAATVPGDFSGVQHFIGSRKVTTYGSSPAVTGTTDYIIRQSRAVQISYKLPATGSIEIPVAVVTATAVTRDPSISDGHPIITPPAATATATAKSPITGDGAIVRKTFGTTTITTGTTRTISFGATVPGRQLLLIAASPATLATSTTGWTEILSYTGDAEIAVFAKTSTGDSSVVLNQNVANYKIAWQFYELDASGTYIAGTGNAINTLTFPDIAGLGTNHKTLIAARGSLEINSTGGASTTWDTIWTEDSDQSNLSVSGRDGPYLTSAHVSNFRDTSITPTAATIATGNVFSTNSYQHVIIALDEPSPDRNNSAPAASGSARAQTPTVTAETVATGGASASASAVALAPTIVAARGVSAVAAQASASARVPVVSYNGAVTAVAATATALARPAAQVGMGNLVQVVRATATAAGRAPALGLSPNALAVPARATARSYPGMTGLLRNITITAIAAPISHWDTGTTSNRELLSTGAASHWASTDTALTLTGAAPVDPIWTGGAPDNEWESTTPEQFWTSDLPTLGDNL